MFDNMIRSRMFTVEDVKTPMQVHNENVDKMHEIHAKTGRWIDPVTGKEFPSESQKIVKDPNRSERRRLEQWRRTGKSSTAGNASEKRTVTLSLLDHKIHEQK